MERVRPYQDKRQMYALIVVLVIMLLALFLSMLLLGKQEDKWVCKDGVWIEQGNPSTPIPNTPCE